MSAKNLIAAFGSVSVVTGIVVLGIVPAASAVLSPHPEKTVSASPAASTPSTGAPTSEPGDDPALTCEALLAAGARPPIEESARITYKDEIVPPEFDGLVNEDGKPVKADSKLVVSPEVTVSSYFTRLGCADDGKVWAVVVLGDDYSLDVSDGRNGASYDSVLDETASSFSLTTIDRTEYRPIEVFVTGPAGLHAAVFEVPEGIEGGVVDGSFIFTSTLDLYYGSVDLPQSVTHQYEMIATPFKLDGKWGCSIGAEWC